MTVLVGCLANPTGTPVERMGQRLYFPALRPWRVLLRDERL